MTQIPSPVPVRRRTGTGGRAALLPPIGAALLPPIGAALLVLVGAVLLVLITPTGAGAHAELQTTTPANGAVVDRAPTTVTVQFTESVQVNPDGLRVLAADGTRVDLADAARSPGSPATVAVTLRSGLRDGTYTVAWRATSADSHPVHGAFSFTVGAPGSTTGPLAGADQGADPVVSALVVFSRGAGYAGLALLIGATGILLLLARGADPRRPRALARVGLLTVLLSAVVSLLAQGPHLAGSGVGSLLDPTPLRETLAGRPGLAILARALIAATLLLLPAMIRPHTPPPAARRRALTHGARVLLPTVALAATFSAAGHPMTGRQIPVAVAADVLHLTAMGLWLGGLVTLVALYLHPSAPGPLGATIRRFSTLAAWCVGVLVVTGVYQAARQGGTPGNLLTTEYGRLLTAKVAAVLLLIGLGYTARRWTRRHARPTATPDPGARHRIRRTLAAEAAIGAVVLTLSTLLAATAPPREHPVRPPTAAPTPATAATPAPAATAMVVLEAHYDTGTGSADTGTVTVGFVRRATGAYGMDLRVTGPSGKPTTPEEVTVTWSLPANKLGPLPVTLVPTGIGHWRAETFLVPTGDWLMTVRIRTSDIDADSVTFATSNAALDTPARSTGASVGLGGEFPSPIAGGFERGE